MLMATVVGGGCNFLYQILMGNFIQNDLAELNTLLGILYIASVPSSAVQNVIIRYVSKFKVMGEENMVAWLLKRIMIFASLAGVAIAILLLIILSVPSVASTIKVTSTLPVMLIAIGVVISMISPVGQGAMQAFQRFTPYGALTVGNFVLKLTFGVGMVLLGYGISGALGGVVVGLAFACGASIIFVRKYFFMASKPAEGKDIWRFTIPATVALLGYSVITQADVIFATSLLPATEADAYSAASQLAKIILYLPGAVSTVMFPKISKAHAESQLTSNNVDETSRILRAAFIMTVALSGLVVAVYFLFPNTVINILYPLVAYKDQIAPILQWLGVAIMHGQITVIEKGRTPCLRCLFPRAPEKRLFPILGSTAGVFGCLQAAEAVKLLTGVGQPLRSKLLVGDLERNSWETIDILPAENCPTCGEM